MTPLTEDQIERRVERTVDHLDRVFLSGGMSQSDYDKAMHDLNFWAAAQYELIDQEMMLIEMADKINRRQQS